MGEATGEVIRVRGAREQNLRDVDVDLPKRRLTVVTGVSGSGKSSLVFATIAAESQRLINETYPAFVQGFMASPARPDVDVLEGLTPAIVVDQERLAANPRSTVGTVTDVTTLLRILFSRLAEPRLPSPKAYSFNVATVSGAGAIETEKGGRTVKERRSFTVAGGMCPRCEGRGEVQDIDLDELFDPALSLEQGALRVPGLSMDGWQGRIYRGCGYFDVDVPIGDFTPAQLDDLLHREPTRMRIDGINLTYRGLLPMIRSTFLAKDVEAMQPHVRAFVERVVTFRTCPDCAGTRLNEAARTSLIEGRSIADLGAMEITELRTWLADLADRVDGAAAGVAPLLARIGDALGAFDDVGLGDLTLDRPSGSLSGGEAQRTRLVRHLGSALTDITYVFDEPTTGLHPHDVDRLHGLLLRLRDKGNTVLVVEHKPATIAIADHVVDLGPGAGPAGGRIVYQGDVAGLRRADTPTGRHLADVVAPRSAVRTPTGVLPIRGARRHNLRDVDVDVPLGVLCVVTGVAGSGKSSLLLGGVLGGLPGPAVVVDQSPLHGSRRSNPGTYSGALEPIRKAFAKANGVKPALFSSNSAGACPACGGSGVVQTELVTMAAVATTCEDCEGRRFHDDVLQYRLGGHDIAQVLAMPVAQAREFVADAGSRVPAAAAILQRLVDVGLGYVGLGQPLTTLSGGERQRLRLAVHLGEQAPVLVLDEPTTGLHLADVAHLLALLDRMVDDGRSVIVIEHHQAVIAHADHVIDLGPGAGRHGGRVVFEGPPADLARADTPTGRAMASYLASSTLRG
ncbi:ATP-binding cassette domain-containing protein [Nocardioides sp.]|uniref:ATP-binding cassette domain-containing protein n=1 Tax=Nocardioides sp. TaxID=35761 RepID=UPI003514AEE5